jgi:hypothetical protein
MAHFSGLPISDKRFADDDGIEGDEFTYLWDSNAPVDPFGSLDSDSFAEEFADAFDVDQFRDARTQLSDQVWRGASLTWANIIGHLCPQVNTVMFMFGGSYSLVSFRDDGFDRICSKRVFRGPENLYRTRSCEEFVEEND